MSNLNFNKLRSFGCVLYEMVFMKRLFEGRKPQIISDVTRFKDTAGAGIRFENVAPVFQTIIKK